MVASEGPEDAATQRVPRKKLALVVGYDGSYFMGSQANRSNETVDSVLAHALYTAGLISPNARDGTSFGNMWWSRASRTDRGVHALCNTVTVKARAPNDLFSSQRHSEELKNRLNAILPPYIRVFSVARCVQGFHARTDASSRVYHYFLPVEALFSPEAATTAAARGGALVRDAAAIDSRLSDMQGILDELVGTHFFHNFTKPFLRSEMVTPRRKKKDAKGAEATPSSSSSSAEGREGAVAASLFGSGAGIDAKSGDQPTPPWLKQPQTSASSPSPPPTAGTITRLIHDEWLQRLASNKGEEGESGEQRRPPKPHGHGHGHGAVDQTFTRVFASLFEGADFSSNDAAAPAEIKPLDGASPHPSPLESLKTVAGWHFAPEARRTIFKAQVAGPFWLDKKTKKSEGGRDEIQWRLIGEGAQDGPGSTGSTGSVVVPPVFETNVDSGSQPGSIWDRQRYLPSSNSASPPSLTTYSPASPSPYGLVRITLHGSSFLLNQIRMMVGAALFVLHGRLPREYLKAAFSLPLMPMPFPKAPSAGLVQAEVHFKEGTFTTLYHPPGTSDDAVPVVGEPIREARVDAHGHVSPLTALNSCSDIALLLSPHRAEQAKFFEEALLPRIAEFCGWQERQQEQPQEQTAQPSQQQEERVDEGNADSANTGRPPKLREEEGITPVKPSGRILAPIKETAPQYFSLTKAATEVPSKAQVVDAALRWYREAWAPSRKEQEAKKREVDLAAQAKRAIEIWRKDAGSEDETVMPPLHVKEPLHLTAHAVGASGRIVETAYERDQRERREKRATGYLRAAEAAQAYSRSLAPSHISPPAKTTALLADKPLQQPLLPARSATPSVAPALSVYRLRNTPLAEIRHSLFPNGLFTALSIRTGITRERDLDALVTAIAWRVGNGEWPVAATAEQHAEWASSPAGASMPALLVREGRFLAMKEKAEIKAAAEKIKKAATAASKARQLSNANANARRRQTIDGSESEEEAKGKEKKDKEKEEAAALSKLYHRDLPKQYGGSGSRYKHIEGKGGRAGSTSPPQRR